MASSSRAALRSCGLEDLDEALLGLVAESFTLYECALYDRHDILQQAATLAEVGSSATMFIAQALYRHLSPHLGEELDIHEDSTAVKMKAQLKAWGLVQAGKTKTDLWNRIQEQLADSVEPPPKYCKVSAATRRELTGWSSQRISQDQCKDKFLLTKSDLGGLPFVWQNTNSFFGAKLYKLSDVKEKALQRHGGPDKLVRQKQREDASRADWDSRSKLMRKEKAERGREELAAELSKHGVRATDIAAMMEPSSLAFKNVMDGMKSWGCNLQQKAEYLERMHFASQGPASEYWQPWQGREPAKKKMGQMATDAKLERLAKGALAAWVSHQPSKEALATDPRVPAHMMAELQGYWGRLAEVERELERYYARAQVYGGMALWMNDAPVLGMYEEEFYGEY